MPGRIAIVGSINVDLVVQAARIPRPGETVVDGGPLQRFPGGKGANQACAAAKLGASVSLVGCVGNDEYADPALTTLLQAGVDTTHVRRDAQATTGLGVIFVDQAAENAIIVSSGANMCVTAADVAAAAETICAADLLVLQLEIPLPAVVAAARVAHEAGVRVLLNPAPARELPTELLDLVDILIPNEIEAAMLARLPINGDPGLQAVAAVLGETGIETIVVTRGGRGCVHLAAGGLVSHPTFGVEAIDTTAAGDAFVGAFAAALVDDASTEEAIRYGCAAGALATTRVGAQSSLPSREAVEALVRGAGGHA